jgi:hypothetical protein
LAQHFLLKEIMTKRRFAEHKKTKPISVSAAWFIVYNGGFMPEG